MSIFFQYIVNGLTVGSFYAIIALGYTMIYGIIRLINFAHGDFVMVGAFIGWSVLGVTFVSHLPAGTALALALVGGSLGVGALAVGVDRVAYQPLLKHSRLTILITALGVSMALENGVQIGYGAGYNTYPEILPVTGFTIANVSIGWVQLGIFVLNVLLMLALYTFVERTYVGTAMRALALDQDAARLMGINVERVIMLTFLLGGILAAVAGVMMGVYYTQISFFMGFLLGLKAFTAAVLGGIGNIPGAMIGGILIGLIESLSSGYVSAEWNDVIVFGVLILVLVIKPTGILGERVVERM